MGFDLLVSSFNSQNGLKKISVGGPNLLDTRSTIMKFPDWGRLFASHTSYSSWPLFPLPAERVLVRYAARSFLFALISGQFHLLVSGREQIPPS